MCSGDPWQTAEDKSDAAARAGYPEGWLSEGLTWLLVLQDSGI